MSYHQRILFFLSLTANAAVPENNSAYRRLEGALSLYEAGVQRPWPRILGDQPLFLGIEDSSVIALRERLCATHDLAETICRQDANKLVFDHKLEKGVEFFQRRHGLVIDGIVGQATRQALNVSPAEGVHHIQINLHRWSRLIELAEPAYIWINVPDHHLRLVKDHHIILTSRIIVGKASRQTPEINSKVTRIILNPYWTVPPGIARRDVIPKIIQDKDYLRQNRLRVFIAQAPYQELEVDEVDWFAARKNPSRYILRQDPGPHNALGQIKFEFANPYLVYLHDTPAKRLFNANKRLFSSGCVRMEDPFELLDALAEFDPSLKRTESQIERTLESGKTVVLQLKQPIPIHLTYITAWVDREGILHFWDDVYGRDPVFSSRNEKLEDDLVEPA